MTRILHLLETADPQTGGPIEAAYRIGLEWGKQGHVQDLVTLDAPDERFLPDYPGKISAIGPARGNSPAQRFRYDSGAVAWLRAAASSYDAVIVSGLWRYQTRAGWQALAGGATPYFVFTHGMLDPWFRKTYPLKHATKQLSWWFAEGPLLAHARGVIFTCEEERRLSQNAFWPYRADAAVVPLGTADVEGDPATQLRAFAEAMPALSGKPFLLFLSRIHPKKGCDLLIDAFAAAAAASPELHLVIAGPDQVGIAAALQAQAARHGLAERVHFPGMLQGDIKYGAYRAAMAFTLTSHQENFGIVVAEAMACSTPVLISDKVNIWREIVADGAGFAESDTPTGAWRLLTRFLALSPDQQVAMGTMARESFLARFHIAGASRALMEMIESRIAQSEG